MTTMPLAQILVDLLQGHGVEASVSDGLAHLPQLGRWANLWITQERPGTFLLELRATTAGAVVVADRWAGIGQTAEDAQRDGLKSFCQGTFHVLLAVLWGVLEREQVDHEVRTLEGRDWDFYLGPCTLRTSVGVPPLVLPAELPDVAIREFSRYLTDGEVHTARVYVGVVNGVVTLEAVIDDATSIPLQDAVAQVGWSFPAAGFASLRWFFAACPRGGGPSHRVERTCRVRQDS